jgi:hypothetical protein
MLLTIFGYQPDQFSEPLQRAELVPKIACDRDTRSTGQSDGYAGIIQRLADKAAEFFD